MQHHHSDPYPYGKDLFFLCRLYEGKVTANSPRVRQLGKFQVRRGRNGKKAWTILPRELWPSVASAKDQTNGSPIYVHAPTTASAEAHQMVLRSLEQKKQIDAAKKKRAEQEAAARTNLALATLAAHVPVPPVTPPPPVPPPAPATETDTVTMEVGGDAGEAEGDELAHLDLSALADAGEAPPSAPEAPAPEAPAGRRPKKKASA